MNQNLEKLRQHSGGEYNLQKETYHYPYLWKKRFVLNSHTIQLILNILKYCMIKLKKSFDSKNYLLINMA